MEYKSAVISIDFTKHMPNPDMVEEAVRSSRMPIEITYNREEDTYNYTITASGYDSVTKRTIEEVIEEGTIGPHLAAVISKLCLVNTIIDGMTRGDIEDIITAAQRFEDL